MNESAKMSRSRAVWKAVSCGKWKQGGSGDCAATKPENKEGILLLQAVNSKALSTGRNPGKKNQLWDGKVSPGEMETPDKSRNSELGEIGLQQGSDFPKNQKAPRSSSRKRASVLGLAPENYGARNRSEREELAEFMSGPDT